MVDARRPQADASRATRKDLLVRVAGGSLLATLAFVTRTGSADAQDFTDNDNLNFLLNFEYLEAEFYNRAIRGVGINKLGATITGSGTAGATVGGSKVTLQGKVVNNTARWLTDDSLLLVAALRETLGGNAVAKPAIDLAAIGYGFKNTAGFLLVSRALSDTLVSVYGGVLPLLSSKDVAASVTKMLIANAEHSGALRNLISLKGIRSTALDTKDLIPPPAGGSPFSLDRNGLGIIRTPQETLAIVQPLFPKGLNGAIK